MLSAATRPCRCRAMLRMHVHSRIAPRVDVGAWRLFFMFLVQLFLKINAGARNKQTNHQKINTVLHRGNAKCDGQEAFARGTTALIDETIDDKQLISNRPTSCSAAKKQTKDVHLSRSLLPLFRDCSSSLSLSPDRGSERALTDIANEHAQESDRAMVCRTSSSFFSVNVNVLPTTAITHKKNFLWTSPRRYVPESFMMNPSCSSAPIKATHEAGPWFILKSDVLPRTTLKLTNLPSPSVSIILLLAWSNLSLSLRLLRTVLVQSEKFLDLPVGTVTRPPCSIYARVNCFVIRDWCTRVQGHPRNLFRRPWAFVAKAPHLTIPRQSTLVYGGKLIFSNAAAKLPKATMDFLF